MKRVLLMTSLCLSVVALSHCGKKKPRTLEEPVAAEATSAGPTASSGGVTEDKIRIGQIAGFSGTVAGVGTEMWRGAVAYFQDVNAAGGIHGRTIEVVPFDDGFTAEKAEAATDKALAAGDLLWLMGSSGTDPTVGILKSIAKYKQGMMLFGTTTGADIARKGPLAEHVFNLRASVGDAGRVLANAYRELGLKKIGILMLDDFPGKNAGAAAHAAVIAAGGQVVGEATMSNATRFEDGRALEQVKALRSAGAEAVIIACTYHGASTFIREAREQGWNAPMGVMTTSDTLVRLLASHEKKTGKRMLHSVFSALTVPPVSATTLPLVADYRRLIDLRNPRLPSELQDPNYRLLRYSSNGVEGFTMAKIVGEALRRAGRTVNRESLRTAMEALKDYDPGVGQKVSYGPSDHFGFDDMWLGGVANEELVLVSDVKAYVKSTEPPAANGPKAGVTAAK